jgi:hypothetical protein
MLLPQLSIGAIYVFSDEDARMRELTKLIAYENDPANLKVLAEELGLILAKRKLLPTESKEAVE